MLRIAGRPIKPSEGENLSFTAMSIVDRHVWQPDPTQTPSAGFADDGTHSPSPAPEPQLLRTRDIPPMAIPNDTIDYSEVLRDLAERRVEMDAAIRAIRRIVGHPGSASTVATPQSGGVTSASAAAASIRAALDRTTEA